MKIDFYLVSEKNSAKYIQFVCKLVDKIYHLDLRIYIHTKSMDDAVILDDRLWTFNQGSFLPHTICENTAIQDTPIIIGYLDQLVGKFDVLINLSESVPGFFEQFSRIAEVVDSSENNKKLARDRFRFYQHHSYKIDTHHIDI